MGIEIERKFLVSDDRFKSGAEAKSIIQGFLMNDISRSVRIRIMGNEAFLTIKGTLSGSSRPEFEYPIPVEDAKALLKICPFPVIAKTRYFLKHKELVWEVDEFEGVNEGLIIAEVELPNEEYDLKLPDWVGTEVTHDTRYYNANLVTNPYNTWSEK